MSFEEGDMIIAKSRGVSKRSAFSQQAIGDHTMILQPKETNMGENDLERLLQSQDQIENEEEEEGDDADEKPLFSQLTD